MWPQSVLTTSRKREKKMHLWMLISSCYADYKQQQWTMSNNISHPSLNLLTRHKHLCFVVRLDIYTQAHRTQVWHYVESYTKYKRNMITFIYSNENYRKWNEKTHDSNNWNASRFKFHKREKSSEKNVRNRKDNVFGNKDDDTQCN